MKTQIKKIIKKPRGRYVIKQGYFEKVYDIRGLANLIDSERNFCIEHSAEIAQDLRNYWQAKEDVKSAYMGGGLK